MFSFWTFTVSNFFQEFEKRRETRWGNHAQENDDDDEAEKESGENDPEDERNSDGDGSQTRVNFHSVWNCTQFYFNWTFSDLLM